MSQYIIPVYNIEVDVEISRVAWVSWFSATEALNGNYQYVWRLL